MTDTVEQLRQRIAALDVELLGHLAASNDGPLSPARAEQLGRFVVALIKQEACIV